MPPEGMTRHIAPVKLELNAVDDKGIVEGYASAYDTMTAYGQKFNKGAFAETLQRPLKQIKVLFNHNWDQIVGVPLELREDSNGLYTKTQLLTRTQKGAEMYELAKAGALDAFSIGFFIDESTEETIDGMPVISINKATVMEYSLVTFGANPGAVITGVNSLPKPDDEAGELDLSGPISTCDSILKTMALHNAGKRIRRISAQLER